MTEPEHPTRYLVAVMATIEVVDHAQLEDSVSPFLQDAEGNPEGMIVWDDEERLQTVLMPLFHSAVNATTDQTGVKCWGGGVFVNPYKPDGSVDPIHIPGIPPRDQMP